MMSLFLISRKPPPQSFALGFAPFSNGGEGKDEMMPTVFQTANHIEQFIFPLEAKVAFRLVKRECTSDVWGAWLKLFD
jgi:hypothetical protein